MTETAAHRPKPTGDDKDTVSPGVALQFRRFYFCLWALTAMLAAGIVGVIIVSAIYGEKIVTTLLATAPENLVQQAKSLELRGDKQAAIELYREALEYEIEDPDMRLLAAVSLGDLLGRQELYEDALHAYQVLRIDEYRTSGSLTGYVRALESTGDLDNAERIGLRWLAMAVAEGNLRQQIWANSMLGTVTSRVGRDVEALAYFQAAEALRRASNN